MAGNASGLTAVNISSQVITVAPAGAQYTTVGAAIAAIGTPTVPTTILVSPGAYAENPFVLQGSVSIRGIGGQPSLNFTSSPAITVSTSNVSSGIEGVTVFVTNFSGPAVKIDGQLVGSPITPNNPVTFGTGAGIIGNPAVLVTGSRQVNFINSNALGVINPALRVSSTGTLLAVNAQFVQLVDNFNAVQLDNGTNTNSRFLDVYLHATGSGKGLISSVPTTLGMSGVVTRNDTNSIQGVTGSTSIVVSAGGMSVSGSTLAFGAAPAAFNGTAYSESALPPSNFIVSTASGTVFRTTSAGFLRTIGQQTQSYGYANAGGTFAGICVGGTEAAPTACASGSNLTFIGAKGFDGATNTNGQGSTGALVFSAAEAFTATARGTAGDIETTTAGTTTRRKRVRVTNEGKVVIAPRANSLLPVNAAALTVSGNDAGIGITTNTVSIHALEAISAVSSVTASAFFGNASGLTGALWSGSVISADFTNRILKTSADVQVMDWGGGGGGGNLADDSGVVSVKWNDRYLRNAAGNTIFDWSGTTVTVSGGLDVGGAATVDSLSSSGEVSAGGGSNIVYYCSGSTGGTFDGNLARGNGNAGACAGGTWIATSLKVD
jgi:hypothetical protein